MQITVDKRLPPHVLYTAIARNEKVRELLGLPVLPIPDEAGSGIEAQGSSVPVSASSSGAAEITPPSEQPLVPAHLPVEWPAESPLWELRCNLLHFQGLPPNNIQVLIALLVSPTRVSSLNYLPRIFHCVCRMGSCASIRIRGRVCVLMCVCVSLCVSTSLATDQHNAALTGDTGGQQAESTRLRRGRRQSDPRMEWTRHQWHAFPVRCTISSEEDVTIAAGCY